MNGVVLFGYANAGRHLAEQLRQQGVLFTVVDRDAANIEAAQQAGFESRLADYTDDNTLRELGIGDTAQQLFCMLPQDSENLFLTLSARALAPDISIVSACESSSAAEKLQIAGANMVVDLYSITAHRVHNLLTKPLVVDVLDHTLFGQADLQLAEIVVPVDPALPRRSLQQLDLASQFNLVLIGIIDRERSVELHFVEAGKEHMIDGGDILAVIGQTADIERLRQQLSSTESVN